MRNILASSSLAVAAIIAAATFATPQTAIAQQGDRVCLQAESGAVDCSFRTIGQCLDSVTGPADTCGINPDYYYGYGGTVGFGGIRPNAADAENLRPREPAPDMTR
jgi:hypothetical protein